MVGIKNKSSDDLILVNYVEIISSMCKEHFPPNRLELLKVKFISDIDSVRTYDSISNLEELIRVLERRNVLSATKIIPLFTIAEMLNYSQRIGLLLNYQAKILSGNRNCQQVSDCVIDMSLLTDYSPVLPESAIAHISCNVKKNWAQFARALKIQENIIDKIDHSYLKDEEKAGQVVQVYFNEAKLQRLGNPYVILLTALESIRRRDIKEKVEEILQENLEEKEVPV